MNAHGPQGDRLRRRLAAWAAFPADRQPRPLVLLGPTVRPGGFPADGRAKEAFARGLIQAAPGFPAQVLNALRSGAVAGGPPATPLRLTTATRASAEFLTDRGPRHLPAWRVRAEGVAEPIWVLDPDTRQRAWRPPALDADDLVADGSAHLHHDGRGLTLRFVGTPSAYADYPRAEVIEHGAAVAIVPVEVDTAPPGFRLLYAETREVTAILTRPLGPRILLDSGGQPVPVSG